jgi:hypothetical protein
MRGKSLLFAVTLLGFAAGPLLAQGAGDAGVSGIPRGPGNVGGLNNSLNDPSGIGNAARIAPPPAPTMAAPAVPSAAPALGSRMVPRLAPAVRLEREEVYSRKARRPRSHGRIRHKPIDARFSICRGC